MELSASSNEKSRSIMLSEENRWSGTNANNNDLMVRPESMAGTVVLV
jgi:hypothetical protein